MAEVRTLTSLVSVAVAGPATLAHIKAKDRVGYTPNIGVGTQVSLVNILRKALAKEDIIKKCTQGDKL